MSLKEDSKDLDMIKTDTASAEAAYFLVTLDKASLSYSSVFGIQADAHLHGNEYSLLGSVVYIAQLVFQPISAIAIVRCASVSGSVRHRVRPRTHSQQRALQLPDHLPRSRSLTVVYGISTFFTVPDNIDHAYFLKGDEKRIAKERVRFNQGGTDERKFNWNQALETLIDPKTWLWLTLGLLISIPLAASPPSTLSSCNPLALTSTKSCSSVCPSAPCKSSRCTLPSGLPLASASSLPSFSVFSFPRSSALACSTVSVAALATARLSSSPTTLPSATWRSHRSCSTGTLPTSPAAQSVLSRLPDSSPVKQQATSSAPSSSNLPTRHTTAQAFAPPSPSSSHSQSKSASLLPTSTSSTGVMSAEDLLAHVCQACRLLYDEARRDRARQAGADALNASGANNNNQMVESKQATEGPTELGFAPGSHPAHGARAFEDLTDLEMMNSFTSTRGRL
ncbi:hypothetical protein U1Q18_051439 [Sarracenia purpurea var. burkii]